ncbi:hypothetical protein GCM10008983_09630 [Lentibacillus halophilus]|uniref:SLH domain-containing protein n=2 Tax=Lentibacillus halophilus TaxID=295065 RepID=A0ABN0Z671_9BACI
MTNDVNNRRVIIQVKDDHHFAADKWGIQEITSKQLLRDQYNLVRIPNHMDYTETLDDIKQASNVAMAEPDYIRQKTTVPSDIGNDKQWYLDRIQMPQAWDVETGSSDVTIAVLDTGVDAGHPELNGRVRSGYDFVNNDRDPDDDNGHGTSVAGVIAANANEEGVSGIDLGAELLPVKIANNAGEASVYHILEGIQYAIDQGADVINMSFVSYRSSKLEKNAVQKAYEAGILQVAAVGNKAINEPSYPAAYPAVIGVAATNQQGDHAEFSNYGDAVDVTAPGQSIYTVHKGDRYDTYQGTSYATPIVSGIGGLLKAHRPSWSNVQLKKALEASAVSPDKAEWTGYFGYGQVNAHRALTMDLDGWSDDVPNTQASAKALAFDQPVSEKINHSMDNDWYRLEVDKRSKVTIKLSNPSQTLDLTAELHDADGPMATLDAQAAGGDEHDTFTADAGTYYLNVQTKHHRWSTVPYDISISKQFPDVERYANEIQYLTQQGIIHGFSDGTFKPNQNVTRLQAVQMLLSEMDIDGDQATVSDPGFKDVHADTYGYEAIAKAAELDLINGKEDVSFDAGGQLTRGQMAAMLVSAYDLTGAYNDRFTDVPNGHWAHDSIDILAANDMAKGYPDHTFRPEQPISREHFSLFLYNYMNG